MMALTLLYLGLALRVLYVAFFSDSSSQDAISAVRRAETRGNVLDRNGEVLATSLVSTSVYARPASILNDKEVAAQLASIFADLRYGDVLKKLRSTAPFVWLKRNITPAQEERVHNIGAPGIFFERSYKRVYPHHNIASHVVGYVDIDGNGLAGLENSLDAILRTNTDVRSSIDVKVQTIVREELKKAVQEFNAKGGVGIIQKTTGEVLAMVSLPDFDPNHPNAADNEAKFNRATLGVYETGSVFKAFTVAMALDSGTTTLESVYDVNDPIVFGKYKITDYQAKGGWMSVPQILMYSSNLGVSQMAVEMGKANHFQYLKKFGFDEMLPIELAEKSKGKIPSLAQWKDVTSVTTSYGYGVSASPLHLTTAMSGLVGGGNMFMPTLINDKVTKSRAVIAPHTSELMKKLLRMIVRFGSGQKAEVPGIFLGGKTGTANKISGKGYDGSKRISSFLGAFPVHTPKYVIFISLDEPKGNKSTFGFATGGWVATPVVGRIISRASVLLGTLPDLYRIDEQDKALFVEYDHKKHAAGA